LESAVEGEEGGEGFGQAAQTSIQRLPLQRLRSVPPEPAKPNTTGRFNNGNRNDQSATATSADAGRNT
jgi:hypothetical protein